MGKHIYATPIRETIQYRKLMEEIIDAIEVGYDNEFGIENCQKICITSFNLYKFLQEERDIYIRVPSSKIQHTSLSQAVGFFYGHCNGHLTEEMRGLQTLSRVAYEIVKQGQLGGQLLN